MKTAKQKFQEFEVTEVDMAYQKNLGASFRLLDEITKLIDAKPLSNRDYGHVGDMAKIKADLQEIKDRLAQTGEYA